MVTAVVLVIEAVVLILASTLNGWQGKDLPLRVFFAIFGLLDIVIAIGIGAGVSLP